MRSPVPLVCARRGRHAAGAGHATAAEIATLEWVHWFNHHRLLERLGHAPPAECETAYYRQPSGSAIAA